MIDDNTPITSSTRNPSSFSKSRLVLIAGSVGCSVIVSFLQLAQQANNITEHVNSQMIDELLKPMQVPRSGAFVLGMHRSGTSMLTGVLSEVFGFALGDDLIPARHANTKGYFENADLVRQNMILMKSQDLKVNKEREFDADAALADSNISWENGLRVVAFINETSVKGVPWLLKDPRSCITLRTWLPHLPDEPAVVFTYRNPVAVAQSLKKRDRVKMHLGFSDWIEYNRMSLQGSDGLCRVVSSNERILQDTHVELERITQELVDKCNLPSPPGSLKTIETAVAEFVDVSLQHSSTNALPKNDSLCEIPEYSPIEKTEDLRALEVQGHDKAMSVYCDLRNGKAFERDYVWPRVDF